VLSFQVSCTNIANSVAVRGGSCECTRAPFTLSAFNGYALSACLVPDPGIGCQGPCPVYRCPDESYPVGVADDKGVISRCLTTDTPCPRGYMPLLGDSPLRQLRCQPTKPACTTDGYGVPMAESEVFVTPTRGGGRLRDLSGRGCRSRRGCGSGTITSGGSSTRRDVRYAAELRGCVSTMSTGCPEGFVAFRSGKNNFQLELCTETSQCYAASSTVTISPSQYGTYTVPALRGDTLQLVGCLELAGQACPPEYPRNTTQGGAPACST
jgi:hypothetical protein